ncbi:MAG: IS1595 family transposase [Rikenellaceae bacterium]
MGRENKFRGVNSIKFNRYFQSDDDCYKYLADVKWADGYVCRKCGHTKYYRGSKPHSRRCMKCKYDESPTAGTMFDKCKFSLLIAFHIAFKIATKKKGMSSLELSAEFELRQKTCWAFKWKIQQAMQSSLQYPINEMVCVDEFFVGGEEEGVRGRQRGKKRLVVVAVEIVKKEDGSNGMGRAYARVIPNASSKSFKPFFDDHISKEAKIITDEWQGYVPLKQYYPNLEQVKSDKGKGMPELHNHIMNLKGWLRGIHHHCSEEHLQGYLDEYHYRCNRRTNMGVIFDKLIVRMVQNEPKRLYSNL